MFQLVETIKIDNGVPLNLEYHTERLTRSVKELFEKVLFMDLKEKIEVPSFARKGIFKCRVEYDYDIRKIEFLPYQIIMVYSLKIIERDDIEYRYKYVDRTQINEMLAMCGTNGDFLLIKNGMVTDTSCANIIFKNERDEWYTPASYLLPGTKRASLLRRGIIRETKIAVSDMKKYSEARLINALIDIDDTKSIPISRINY
jgi:4-amino-4-deoxychorismate lyase